MSAFASFVDLQERWRPLTDDEQIVAAAMLESASRYVRHEYTDIDARIGVTLDVDTVTDVVCWMVRRAMLRRTRGEGLKESSRQIASVTITETYYNFGDDADELYLTDRERTMLAAPTLPRTPKPRWVTGPACRRW
jgi:hypothetical protein